MLSVYGQKSLLMAAQSVKDHICFTKPFLLKMGCEISGWRFLKVWFFYAGFYCTACMRCYIRPYKKEILKLILFLSLHT